MKKLLSKINADYVGIYGSALCLLHCLALPLLALLKSSAVHTEENHFWDYFFAAVALYAVYHSLKHVARNYLKIMLIGGWLTFMLSLLFDQHFVMQLGSLLLIVAHSLNLYYCRKGACVVA